MLNQPLPGAKWFNMLGVETPPRIDNVDIIHDTDEDLNIETGLPCKLRDLSIYANTK